MRFLPVGDVPEPFVDAHDIADIAFAALAQAGHEFQLYEITGPRALSFPEAYAAELARLDMPANHVDLVMYLLTTVLDGRNTPLADGVQRALGRPPIDFSDCVRRTAATGIWSARQ